jgi:chaperonin GroES
MPPEIDDLLTLEELDGGMPPPDMGMLSPDMPGEPMPMFEEDMEDFGEQEEDPIQRLNRWADISRTVNIAEELDESTLNDIGQRVVRECQIDDDSRSEWMGKTGKAMDLALQVAKRKTHPWDGASNVIFPIITTAAKYFNARAYPAIIQGRNVVKGAVVGKDDGVPMPPETMQQLLQFMGQRQMGQQAPADGLAALSPQEPMPPPQMGGAQPPTMGHNGGPPMEGAEQEQPPQQLWLVKPGAKQERATRIGEHMSWQLLEMPEWESDTDKLTLILPIVGCAFRKTFHDPALSENSSLLVLAQNLIVNHQAKSVERAPRLTEPIGLYPNEIEEKVRTGLFLDLTYEGDGGEDKDAPIEFLEQHRLLDLDDDGYSEPYIVTVHKKSSKVARIVARFDADGIETGEDGEIRRIKPVHYYTKYDFIPNPDGGIYGIGFGQLLNPLNEAINTALNQTFDAASLQNTGGGFIGRGMSMHTGSLRFKLGEWKMLNVPGQTLKDSIVPFNHPGPSPVLFQLIGLLIEAAKDAASVKEVLSGDAALANTPPTTMMALVEQGLNEFTATFKRIHRSLRQEFDKLYRLNSIYLPQTSQYRVGEEWREVEKADYERGGGVQPYSDPNMVTDMQRASQAQFLMAYQNDPLIEQIEVRKRIFTTMGIPGTDNLIVQQVPPNPAILTQTAQLEAINREIAVKEREAATREESARFSRMKDITQALLNIANADKANAATPLEETAQWIKFLEAEMKFLQQPAEGRNGVGGARRVLPPLGGNPEDAYIGTIANALG